MCRATVVESGKGVSETWDYGEGDVWYFRSNEGHMIQGLSDGCTYLAGNAFLHLVESIKCTKGQDSVSTEDVPQSRKIEIKIGFACDGRL